MVLRQSRGPAPAELAEEWLTRFELREPERVIDLVRSQPAWPDLLLRAAERGRSILMPGARPVLEAITNPDDPSQTPSLAVLFPTLAEPDHALAWLTAFWRDWWLPATAALAASPSVDVEFR